MPEPFMPQDRLLVALSEHTAMVRVVGRGSFKVGPALKDFAQCAQGQGVRQFLFDMSECVSMDSTFMGIVAGLSLRLRGEPGGKVVFVRLSERTRYLLHTLGLDAIVEVQAPEAGVPEDLSRQLHEVADHPVCPVPTRRRTSETMLEAHETLAALSAENKARFKDVLTFLREDLASGKDRP